MKKPAKPDAALVGKVANNPRFDKFHNIRNGMDAKAIKDAEENTLYDMKQLVRDRVSKRLQEIYGKTQYRTTVSGRKVRWDEPSQDIEDKQNDAIQKMLQKKKAAAGRARLKSKGAVPVKATTGKKLFEIFLQEARGYKKKQEIIDDADLRNIYNAARALDDYEKWLWWVADEYSSNT